MDRLLLTLLYTLTSADLDEGLAGHQLSMLLRLPPAGMTLEDEHQALSDALDYPGNLSDRVGETRSRLIFDEQVLRRHVQRLRDGMDSSRPWVQPEFQSIESSVGAFVDQGKVVARSSLNSRRVSERVHYVPMSVVIDSAEVGMLALRLRNGLELAFRSSHWRNSQDEAVMVRDPEVSGADAVAALVDTGRFTADEFEVLDGS